MNRKLKLGLFLFFALLMVSIVHAQGTCTMASASGTYAFVVQGASTAVMGASAPPFILHWDAKYAPLALVGMISLNKDGTGQGFWWQINGTVNGGLTTVPFTLTTPESNPDCTGIFEYSYTFAGQAHTNREWFVLLDNGRELRSVSQQGGLPTGTWHTTAHRVSNGVGPVANFGQNKMQGDYLLSVDSLLPVDSQPPMIFGQAALMRFHVSGNGDFTGTWHGKIGPTVAISDTAGHFTVNPDGTFEASLTVAAVPGVTSIARGVLFNEGKSGYLIPLTNLVEGGPAIPQIYGLGELMRVGP